MSIVYNVLGHLARSTITSEFEIIDLGNLSKRFQKPSLYPQNDKINTTIQPRIYDDGDLVEKLY